MESSEWTAYSQLLVTDITSSDPFFPLNCARNI